MEPKLQKSYVAAPSLSEINSKLDRSDWIMRTECPVCMSTAIRPFAEVRHFKYDRCSECGLVLANPAPSDRAASEFYNSDFYANYRTLEEENIRMRLQKKLFPKSRRHDHCHTRRILP